MITEAVIRVILHCSRCNTRFKDDEYDYDDRIAVLWTTEELDKHFPADFSDFDDVQGWVRLADRVLCPGCWVHNEDEDERVEKQPLPAVEDAKLNRERAGYTSAAALERVLRNASRYAEPGDDWVRVTRTGGAA